MLGWVAPARPPARWSRHAPSPPRPHRRRRDRRHRRARRAAGAASLRSTCNKTLTQFRVERRFSLAIPATQCLINLNRLDNGVGSLRISPQLYSSASGHANASVAAHSWSLSNGLVSHLDPGTAVPGDPNQLQQLANQQINARILGAGYCAGGSSYSDGEITYAGSPGGATGAGSPFDFGSCT